MIENDQTPPTTSENPPSDFSKDLMTSYYRRKDEIFGNLGQLTAALIFNETIMSRISGLEMERLIIFGSYIVGSFYITRYSEDAKEARKMKRVINNLKDKAVVNLPEPEDLSLFGKALHALNRRSLRRPD